MVDNTEPLFPAARAAGVARRAAVLTAGLVRTEPTRAYCARCRGKGFDRFEPGRASRRCPRCKGQGSTAVGNTKR